MRKFDREEDGKTRRETETPQPPRDEHTQVMEDQAESEIEGGGGQSRQKTGRQK